MSRTTINNIGKDISKYLANEIEDIENIVIDTTSNVTKEALKELINISPKRSRV